MNICAEISISRFYFIFFPLKITYVFLKNSKNLVILNLFKKDDIYIYIYNCFLKSTRRDRWPVNGTSSQDQMTENTDKNYLN